MVDSTVSMKSLLEMVAQWCRENVKAKDVDEAEQIAQLVGRQVAGVVAQVSIGELDEKDTAPASRIDCECGRRAEYKVKRARGIATLCGPVTVVRAYYYCPHCKRGYTPWDRRQGLDQHQWTASVKALVAEVAGCLTYQETVRLLKRTCDLGVQVRSAEQIVQQVGVRLRAQQSAVRSQVMAGEAVPFIGPPPDRFYIGMDAGKALIDEQWHDVKVGALWTSKPGRDGLDTCDRTWYTAAQEKAEGFGERVYAQAVQCGANQAGERIVIGDGADWIWNLAAEHWPEATQIVDYFHACEHIHDLAKVHYGEGNENGKRWAKEHCDRLKEAGPDSLLRALRRMKPHTEAQREAVRLQLHYFTHHRPRMMYHEFRARKLMIGSGPVEAACKTVIGCRLKRAGMRWSQAGADAVLAIRCEVLNQDYDQIAIASKLAA